jgi:hypothetical protein
MCWVLVPEIHFTLAAKIELPFFYLGGVGESKKIHRKVLSAETGRDLGIIYTQEFIDLFFFQGF